MCFRCSISHTINFNFPEGNFNINSERTPIHIPTVSYTYAREEKERLAGCIEPIP